MISDTLTVTYRRGTHRLLSPTVTLEKIEPLLKTCGITRCADVTYLDNLGIPVYCSIRPMAAVQQVSNGKGLSHDEAKVSALMESIELFHAEYPEPEKLLISSIREHKQKNRQFLSPEALPYFERQNYFSNEFKIEWVEGKDLLSGEPIQIPASYIFFFRIPSLHFTTTNGLASGNHHVEASLHAIYELIERDAAANLLQNEQIPIGEKCRILDLSTIDDCNVRDIVDSIQAAGSKIVVLHVKSCIPIHTFWAVLLNKESAILGSTVNMGWGTHLDMSVAASRAITEAAQSRAGIIHGSREDVMAKQVFRSGATARKSTAFNYFEQLKSNTTWELLRQINVEADENLVDSHACLIERLAKAGHRLVYYDLTKPKINIPVVKVIAPTLKLQYR